MKTSVFLSLLSGIILIACSQVQKSELYNDLESGKYQIAYCSDEEGYAGIFYMDTSGKERIKVIQNEIRNGYPHCSPDGKKLVYYAYHDKGKTWSIHVADIDGSNPQRLTDVAFVFETEPVWSPDGKHIAFTRTDSTWSKSRLWIMNADGSNQRQIGDFKGLAPCFTDNEHILYYSGWDENGEIFRTDLMGKEQVQLTTNNYCDEKPQLSPDGSKIVYVAYKDKIADIFVMNADGRNITQLTKDAGENSDPRWSADSQKIIFESNRDSDNEIFIMNADGSGLKQLTNNRKSDVQPTWINNIR